MTLAATLVWCAVLACEQGLTTPDGDLPGRTDSISSYDSVGVGQPAADSAGAGSGSAGGSTSTGGTAGDSTSTRGTAGDSTSTGGTVGDSTSTGAGGTVGDSTSTGGTAGDSTSTGGTVADSTSTGGAGGGGAGGGGAGGGTGSDTTVARPVPVAGIWIGTSELASKPTSGTAWNNLKQEADRSCGTPNLADQDQRTNVCIMAKALVFARTGQTTYRDGVVSAIRSIATSGRYGGRALSLGRELGAYVIAADLINLPVYDPALDAQFRAKLRELRTTPTSGAARNLIDCNERRPNNWGTQCGGTRAAIAAYLGDQAELDRVARVLRGYLGDRSAYAGFEYGSDLSWQCNAAAPVGVNPAGCTRNGRNLDGVVPDDQRRGGSFTWPPPKENYVYEGLQGILLQAVILSRRGYDVWNWSDRAILRAYRWLHDVASFPAKGDDTWQMHIVNAVYGTSFPAPTPTQPGKNVGWTDWTHR